MPVTALADVQLISGPMLLAYLFNFGLLGVLSVQAYFYFLAFPNERRITKLLVGGVYILELTQTVLLTRDAFDTYATHYGEIGVLNQAQLDGLSVPVLGGIVSCAVQMHYGYSLRVLSGSRLLWLSVAFLSIVQCAAAFVQGIQAFIIGEMSLLASKGFASAAVWLVGSAVCDLMITFGMIFILTRKDTHLPETHALIQKLVRIFVETGCLTAISAVVQMITFILFPTETYFACVGAVLSKLYSNSLLAVLNSRIRIEGVHASPSVHKRTVAPLASSGMNTIAHYTIPPVVDVHIQYHAERSAINDVAMGVIEAEDSAVPGSKSLMEGI